MLGFFNQEEGGAGGSAPFSLDLSDQLGGGGGRSSSLDFSSLGSGLTSLGSVATQMGADDGVTSVLGAAASGAAMGSAGGPIGAAAGAVAGAVMSLFGHKKTDEKKQSADVNAAAVLVGITPSEGAAVIAAHANHSSDHFDDLAAFCATSKERMLQLIDEYNQSNSPKVAPGSMQAEARVVAQQQQQLINSAVANPGFTQTAAGQQLMSALQALPPGQQVGTAGETAGGIFSKILKGIVDGGIKGGSDAAATTQAGKDFKKSYLKDWAKDNQLLVGAIVVGLGITIFKAYGPSHRKISF